MVIGVLGAMVLTIPDELYTCWLALKRVILLESKKSSQEPQLTQFEPISNREIHEQS